VEELLTQASVVLEPKSDVEAKAARVSPLKLDAAAKLYERVKQLDPNNTEAAGGLALVERFRQGKVTHEQLRDQILKDTTRVGIGKENKDQSAKVQGRKERLVRLLQEADTKATQEKDTATPPNTTTVRHR